MKKLILLGLLLLVPLAIADCDQDYKTLEAFYQASMDEDYDAYIALMDTEYIYDQLADEEYYKYYVTAAWEVYDTESHDLELHKCNELETGSVIIFHAESTISHEEGESDIERDYAAVFEEGKIQFVTDLETFSFHQSYAYLLQYYNITKPLLEEEAERAEAIIAYAEETPGERGSLAWLYLLILLGLGILAYRGRDKVQAAAKKAKPDKERVKKAAKTVRGHARGVLKNAGKAYDDHLKKHVGKAKSKTKQLYNKHVKKNPKKRGKKS